VTPKSHRISGAISIAWTGIILTLTILAATPGQALPQKLKIYISWGHQVPEMALYYIKLAPATSGLQIQDPVAHLLEPGEDLKEGVWQTRAGAGDVDGVDFTLAYPDEPQITIQNLHVLWADLIAHSDVDTARRLSNDPGFQLNSKKVTVQTNTEATEGFTFSVDQLRQNKALWVPGSPPKMA